jgi:hypothetical protein
VKAACRRDQRRLRVVWRHQTFPCSGAWNHHREHEGHEGHEGITERLRGISKKKLIKRNFFRCYP